MVFIRYSESKDSLRISNEVSAVTARSVLSKDRDLSDGYDAKSKAADYSKRRKNRVEGSRERLRTSADEKN